MKILQINKYSKLKGGTETVLFQTIDLLNIHGHKVSLLATDGSDNEMKKDGLYYINFPELSKSNIYTKIKKIFDFFYNRKARKGLDMILKNDRPDIIHIHLYLNSFSVSIFRVIKKHNIPVVITLHDYRHICPSYLFLDKSGNLCEKCKRSKYYNCYFSRCFKGNCVESFMLMSEMYFRSIFFPLDRCVDKILFVSKYTMNKHIEYKSSLKNKAELLYNPIKNIKYTEYNRGNYYLYYGRLSREKGIITLIDAARKLRHISFKIVGKGDLRFDTNDIPPNIEFIGFKIGEELKKLITNSAFVIVPSEWYETFGLTVVESFSYSKPVIGARIGAIPEIIQDENNGILFSSGSKEDLIESILKAEAVSDSDYKKMCINANKRASFFSENKYIDGLLDIYNKVIENHKKYKYNENCNTRHKGYTQ